MGIISTNCLGQFSTSMYYTTVRYKLCSPFLLLGSCFFPQVRAKLSSHKNHRKEEQEDGQEEDCHQEEHDIQLSRLVVPMS